ncbi:EAL domain-containing protein [Metabacillus bambusae]|uniref:EAL domain-containing protein n=1 Tax=Metabacillus bambusae TaxID=2795218 RepID=A0ABS3N8Y1_9BACI|nr:EAL domain-containing protein [Metabacillus bambusae]MBO1514496.1 EAL domain-containing protein [Metabacillus bambusae]
MDVNCHSNFQPLSIYPEGYFSVFPNNDMKLIEVLNNLYFSQITSTHYCIAYKTKGDLKEYLSFIHYEMDNISTYEGSIHQEELPDSFDIYSLKTIYEHTFHENTVDIIKHGEFISFLQPIVTLENESILGYESLLRVKDQSIFPSQLFEVAKKTNMLSLLDQKAQEVAIQGRYNKLPKGIKSFINFIPSSISNPELCLKQTYQIVEKYKVSPDDLVFEVAETENIVDLNHLINILKTYKDHGMKVSLDDVSSNFSTLDKLSTIQPDYLSINKKFIQECHLNKDKQTFLKDILQVANELNVCVLAKGIEQKGEYDYLKLLGVHLGQGYYIGRPSETPSTLGIKNAKMTV